MKKAKFYTLQFALGNLPERGFSLLEMLVVLLLLGISSALAIPAIDRGLRGQEVRKSALALAAVARDLRSRAIYEGTPKDLVIHPAENSYQGQGTKKVLLPSDLRITEIEGGEPVAGGMRRLVFFPNGSVLGGEVRLSRREGSAAYVIRVDPLSGRVTIVKGERL